MQFIDVQQHDGIAVLRLNRPPANAIHLGMCDELIALVDQLEADPDCGGLVLTGAPGMFCAGLDIIALRQLDRPEMTAFWRRFCKTFYRLYTTDLVTAAAISGHAPAGGCVLSLAVDYRAMAQGDFKIGLNEVAVGLPVPSFLCDVHVATVGQRAAERMLPHGTMVNPDEARAIGLVHALAPADELLPLVLDEVSRRLQAPPIARAATKRNLRRAAAADIEARLEEEVAVLTEGWFSDECTEVMAALIERLTRKKR